MFRPLALMDNTVSKAFPEVGGVPLHLRSLGIGTLEYYLLGSNPKLAQVFLDVLSKMGLTR